MPRAGKIGIPFVIMVVVLLIAVFFAKRYLYSVQNPTYEQQVPGILLSGCYSGEMNFQGKAYLDANHNGIGEFGFHSELSGLTPLPSGQRLEMLQRR